MEITRKKKVAIIITVAALLLALVVATGAVLSFVLHEKSALKDKNVIMIAPSNNSVFQDLSNTVDLGVPNSTLPSGSGSQSSLSGSNSSNSGSNSYSYSEEFDPYFEFRTYDDKVEWSTDTAIDIFKFSYDETGGLSVVSSNDMKVFAPGTGNEYTFHVKNGSSEAVDYQMWVEAYFSHEDLWIPIEVKMREGSDDYLIGGADEWVEAIELNEVSEEQTLDSNHYTNYTLDWRWVFERFDGEGVEANDAHDTSLGNMAVYDDLTLTIVIHTYAELDPSALQGEGDGNDGGDSFFGDDSPFTGVKGVTMFIVIGAVALVVIIIVLILGRKKKDDDDTPPSDSGQGITDD